VSEIERGFSVDSTTDYNGFCLLLSCHIMPLASGLDSVRDPQ